MEKIGRTHAEPPNLGDHLAAGAAPEGDDLFEAADGELCRERR
jgi:hypothetical protein